jgi:hypothetical protein
VLSELSNIEQRWNTGCADLLTGRGAVLVPQRCSLRWPRCEFRPSCRGRSWVTEAALLLGSTRFLVPATQALKVCLLLSSSENAIMCIPHFGQAGQLGHLIGVGIAAAAVRGGYGGAICVNRAKVSEVPPLCPGFFGAHLEGIISLSR